MIEAANQAQPSQARRSSVSKARSLSEAQFSYLFLIPLIAALLLIAVFPLAYTVWISFNRVPFSLSLSGWQFVGTENFARAVSDPTTRDALLVSLKYSVATTLLSLILSLASALLLNEAFRGRHLLMLLVILPMGLSRYGTAILFRYLLSTDIGMLNAILLELGLINERIQFVTTASAVFWVAVAHTWQMAPFGIGFFLAALQVIPPDMYRVARVDRLGLLGRFRHVTFPYLRGTIVATSVLFAIAGMQVFDIIYFLTNGGPAAASTTLTFLIYRQSYRAYDYGYGAALAYILMAILVVLIIGYYVSYMRQRREAGA